MCERSTKTGVLSASEERDSFNRHPANAMGDALATMPTDLDEYIARIPPQCHLRYSSTRDSDSARQAALAAERLIIDSFDGEIDPVGGDPPRWLVRWSADWYVLAGHVIAVGHDQPDPASPLLLANRLTMDAFHGPDVTRLGHRILANGLAWHQLTGVSFERPVEADVLRR